MFLPTAGLLLGAGFISDSFFYVRAGEQAIVFNYLTGNFHKKIYQEGYHIKPPVISKQVVYETRNRILEETAKTANKHLQ